MDNQKINHLLGIHYQSINKIILSRQDPITGLLPASTAITAHGDYTDAWVRDNVYSILCVWGLGLSYKKHQPNHHRTHILSQSVVKLMRGLLSCMMRQAHKVEAYKNSCDPLDALHAKYGTQTGLAVVADDQWGHLQLDATSLYILMLAQMSASGLTIIYTKDEVDFVQNLVHYIAHTYATADYGIWERGNKINHGNTEINCSSVGMAKAALEAIDEFNLFSNCNTQEGVIHVVLNDIARSRLTLKGLLPRESNSKETDAALLSVIGFPAYAVEDLELVKKTKDTIIEKLCGPYGCKRFLLDGHQSSIEDSSRLHYEPSELREFEDIESQWPLFFTYLLLDALMQGEKIEAQYWFEKLQPVFVQIDGENLLPELYIVPLESIKAEKANPGSQTRVPNENIPLVWAQSLYMLSQMIMQGILEPKDIDPINRVGCLGKSTATTPLVSIIAQNQTVQKHLSDFGIEAESIEQIGCVKILYTSQLSVLHEHLGKNEKLALSGRKLLIPRTITTARVFEINDQKALYLPYYFDPISFYFSFDNNLLVEHFKSSLQFISNSWTRSDHPIVPFFVREDMLRDHSKYIVIDLLQKLQTNQLQGYDINYNTIENLLACANCVQISNTFEYCFKTVQEFDHNHQNETYKIAALNHDWTQVRVIAQQNNLFDIRLEDALLDILTSQKRLAVGRAYSDASIINDPKSTLEILDIIDQFCGENEAEKVLTQEIILHLGHMIRAEENLFENMITIRTWDCIQLLIGHISKNNKISFADAYVELLRYAPHGIYDTLKNIFKSYSSEIVSLKELENIHVSGSSKLDTNLIDPLMNQDNPIEDWLDYRKNAGMLGNCSKEFYKGVWHILQQCPTLVIGDKYSTKSKITAEHTLESTAGERNFELIVDNLLHNINIPEYKQLNIELIETLIKLFQTNPDLYIKDEIILDVLIGYGVRISWSKHNSHKKYDEHKGEAWKNFYTLSPLEVQKNYIEAFKYLIQEIIQ